MPRISGLRRIELYSAIGGTVLMSALFVCGCVATEFSWRDRAIIGAMALGFAVGWRRLRRPQAEPTS
jgi:hypothetical protein